MLCDSGTLLMISAGNPSFRPKEKRIAGGIVIHIVPLRPLGRDSKDTATAEALRTSGPVVVNRNRGKFVIVQSRRRIWRSSSQILTVSPGASGTGVAHSRIMLPVWGNLRLKRSRRT